MCYEMQLSTSSCLPSKLGIPVATDEVLSSLHAVPDGQQRGCQPATRSFQATRGGRFTAKLFRKAMHDFLNELQCHSM